MRICFIDTETTSLRHDRRAWEIGLIIRESGQDDVEHSWFIDTDDLDLGNADPTSLKIGRFFDRHPQMSANDAETWSLAGERTVFRQVESLTRGAILVGGVPNFDADVLGTRMRAHGICPSWHYHLIDFETLIAGYMCGLGKGMPDLPWKSDELSRAVGVEPPGDDERHTALGDARWAARVFNAVTQGTP